MTTNLHFCSSAISTSNSLVVYLGLSLLLEIFQIFYYAQNGRNMFEKGKIRDIKETCDGYVRKKRPYI